MAAPDIEIQDVEISQEPSREWKLDLDSGCVSGFIDGIAAVMQSAFMAIQTERYKYLIFSWQFGSELATLVSKDSDYIFSEGKRMITDALSTDTRITGVRDFVYHDGVINYVIDTIFGSRATQTEVKH